MRLGTTRHSKGCVMLVFMRFGILLPNTFSFVDGSTVALLINKYKWSNSRMTMRETLHAQLYASGRCWILINNHVGSPMVVHSPIRDDPYFIGNKITINWIMSLWDLVD